MLRYVYHQEAMYDTALQRARLVAQAAYTVYPVVMDFGSSRARL